MSNLLLNDTITDVLYEKMVDVGPPDYDDAEIEFARQITKTCPEGDVADLIRKTLAGRLSEMIHEGDVLLGADAERKDRFCGTRVHGRGDVSWVRLHRQIEATCAALNTQPLLAAAASRWVSVIKACSSPLKMALAVFEFMTDLEVESSQG
jgi:hypothetical protein